MYVCFQVGFTKKLPRIAEHAFDPPPHPTPLFLETGRLIELLMLRSFVGDVRVMTEQTVGSELLQAMASCHSLTIIKGKVNGDPVDLKIFQATDWVINC